MLISTLAPVLVLLPPESCVAEPGLFVVVVVLLAQEAAEQFLGHGIADFGLFPPQPTDLLDLVRQCQCLLVLRLEQNTGEVIAVLPLGLLVQILHALWACAQLREQLRAVG